MDEEGAMGANSWIVNVLRPLRDVLTTWPAVLPSRVGDPIRPLKISTYEDMKALLRDPSGDALEILKRAIRRYAMSYEAQSQQSCHLPPLENKLRKKLDLFWCATTPGSEPPGGGHCPKWLF